MQNIELVIFDMAGTTVNENNVVYKTLNTALNDNGFETSLSFVLEHGAGKEKLQAIEDILKVLNVGENLEIVTKANEIFIYFKKLLNEAYLELEVTTYDGVEELIKYLKKINIKIALNTGYDKATAELLLKKLGWSIGVQYDLLVTADDVTKGRPNPDMIYKVMEMLNVFDSNKVLKAGDSIIDIEEGKNADCGFTVGVTTGAHTKKQLESANPTYVLDSLLELRNILTE